MTDNDDVVIGTGPGNPDNMVQAWNTPRAPISEAAWTMMQDRQDGAGKRLREHDRQLRGLEMQVRWHRRILLLFGLELTNRCLGALWDWL